MLTLTLAPFVLALAPTPAQAGGQAAPAPWWKAFPAAASDLVVPGGEDAVSASMMELVEQYAELTCQTFVIRPETRQLLENANTGLHAPLTVPAAEVQPFFETLLIEQDFVLSVLRDEEPRLLSLVSLRTQDRNTVRSRARYVPREHLEVLHDHPAMLVSTTVVLPHADARQLSNSMRTIIVDANTQQMLPAGNSDSMILTGFGPAVADLVVLLERVDAEAEATWKKQLEAEARAAQQQREAERQNGSAPPGGHQEPREPAGDGE